jgi:hypothetical protein
MVAGFLKETYGWKTVTLVLGMLSPPSVVELC